MISYGFRFKNNSMQKKFYINKVSNVKKKSKIRKNDKIGYKKDIALFQQNSLKGL